MAGPVEELTMCYIINSAIPKRCQILRNDTDNVSNTLSQNMQHNFSQHDRHYGTGSRNVLAWYMPSSCVCPSVCLSQVNVLSKWIVLVFTFLILLYLVIYSGMAEARDVKFCT